MSVNMGVSLGRILLSVPHMGGSEETYVREAFESSWLSTVGPNVDAFDHAFEARVGLSAVALASGTAALHLDGRDAEFVPDVRGARAPDCTYLTVRAQGSAVA